MKDRYSSEEKKAVVLLSGGIDSATCVALAKKEGFEVHALTVYYGQRNAWEVESAKLVSTSLNLCEHYVMDVDLRHICASSILGGRGTDYVPGRNLILLSLATAWAETLGARDVFIGVGEMDYPDFPDCQEGFILAFQKACNMGISGEPIRIEAPLARKTKPQIIHMGIQMGVDYSLTKSCYYPSESGEPCGKCRSCISREKAFASLGIADPARKGGKKWSS